MKLNRPEVVAEVRAAFERYEKALVDRDLAVLRECFRDSDDVVHFGVDDAQRGAVELAQWRTDQPPLPFGRSLLSTLITTFGRKSAVVSTFFSYPGRAFMGRQSQTWIKTPVGWRIVHAHVSEVPNTSDGSHFKFERTLSSEDIDR